MRGVKDIPPLAPKRGMVTQLPYASDIERFPLVIAAEYRL
jgi:hypothetical protein